LGSISRHQIAVGSSSRANSYQLERNPDPFQKSMGEVGMRCAELSLLTALLATSISFAQLVVDNPKHLNVSEDQARLLLRMSCRAVAKELHLRESSIPEFNMRLVLGEKDEGFGYEEHTGVPTLFLREWDEKKFVSAALSFAVQRSIDQRRQEQMMLEVLHHYEQTSPISAAQLHKFAASQNALPLQQPSQQKDNCLNRISDATARDVGCQSLGRVR
jgi:hypothetical protein